MSRSLSGLVRRLKRPPMPVTMALSAMLFLRGAAHAVLQGAIVLAKIGVVGAVAAIAFLVAFSG